MSERDLTYAVVTPVRNEATNLRRLAESLASQGRLPSIWVVVDTGSSDETLAIADDLARAYGWISTSSLGETGNLVRGGPIVRAFELGLVSIGELPDVIVKLDADISFAPDYFDRLLREFERDASLGIASGGLFELEGGTWRRRHLTGSTVVGAARSYRRECLQDVLPLEQRMGWDGLDEFKANALGWRTRTFDELELRHHRREGARDGTAWRARRNQGHAAYYLGYRPWYLVLRALWNARRDPAAVAMVWGYSAAAFRREPRSSDPRGRAYLRRQQSIRRLRHRALEASGRRDRAA